MIELRTDADILLGGRFNICDSNRTIACDTTG